MSVLSDFVSMWAEDTDIRARLLRAGGPGTAVFRSGEVRACAEPPGLPDADYVYVPANPMDILRIACDLAESAPQPFGQTSTPVTIRAYSSLDDQCARVRIGGHAPSLWMFSDTRTRVRNTQTHVSSAHDPRPGKIISNRR